MFQFPGFAFVTLCIQVRIPSNDICKSKTGRTFHGQSPLPVSVQTARANALTAQRALELQISKVGFPIRKSSDQSLFAAPRSLSQRTTSFIASQRQGIHRILLRHLIALIIDARPSAYAPKVARLLG